MKYAFDQRTEKMAPSDDEKPAETGFGARLFSGLKDLILEDDSPTRGSQAAGAKEVQTEAVTSPVPIAGASIKEIHNLVQMGLAWDPDIQSKPEFFELSTQLKRQFTTL
jgi:hypothetical protein